MNYEGTSQKYCVALMVALTRLPGQRSLGILIFVGSLLASKPPFLLILRIVTSLG